MKCEHCRFYRRKDPKKIGDPRVLGWCEIKMPVMVNTWATDKAITYRNCGCSLGQPPYVWIW